MKAFLISLLLFIYSYSFSQRVAISFIYPYVLKTSYIIANNYYFFSANSYKLYKLNKKVIPTFSTQFAMNFNIYYKSYSFSIEPRLITSQQTYNLTTVTEDENVKAIHENASYDISTSMEIEFLRNTSEKFKYYFETGLNYVYSSKTTIKYNFNNTPILNNDLFTDSPHFNYLLGIGYKRKSSDSRLFNGLTIRYYIQKRLRDLIDNYEIYDYIIHNSELNKNIKIDYKISKSTKIVVFNYQHIKDIRKEKLKLLLN